MGKDNGILAHVYDDISGLRILEPLVKFYASLNQSLQLFTHSDALT